MRRLFKEEDVIHADSLMLFGIKAPEKLCELWTVECSV